MTKISNQYSLTNILTADLANSRLGINNVSPTVALDVTGAGKFSSSVSATSYNATTQNIFAVDGSEKMRITSGGLVGIGTTTVSSLLTLSQSAFNKTTLGDARVIRLENSDPTVQLNSRQEIGFGYSTAYQPVVIGHQITNNTDFTNGSFYVAVRSGVGNTAPVQALTVIPGGNVGIGTSSPGEKLHIYGGGLGPELRMEGTWGSHWIRAYSDNFNLYTAGGRQAISMNNAGSVFNYNNTTTWQQTSDIRVKENINTISNALDVITSLNPISFNYKQEFAEKNNWDDNIKLNNIGFIAQEFETVFPKYVYTKQYELGGKLIEDFKSIDTGHLVPYLVKAVQELKAEIETLKNK